MSIREQLARGEFGEKSVPAEVVQATTEWYIPESNPFELKDRARLERMEKSAKAREQRHMIRDIKQKRHQLGYKHSSLKY